MKKLVKNPWVYVGVVIIVFIVYGLMPEGSGEYDEFATCLTEAGVTMYGTEWCSHCKNQKALFGNSFRLVDYVDCDREKQECVNAGVKGYPTWKINGQNYPGEQSFQRLSELSGCELN